MRKTGVCTETKPVLTRSMKRVKRGGVSGAANANRKRAASEAAAHVTYEEISQLFGLSLADAAARIGVRTARIFVLPG